MRQFYKNLLHGLSAKDLMSMGEQLRSLQQAQEGKLSVATGCAGSDGVMYAIEVMV